MSSVYSACFSFRLAKEFFLQDFGEADDGVERGAQLVRHVGEELRLVAVGGFDLAALFLDLAKQPGVLDRQDGLGGEGFQKLDDFGAKLAGGFSPYHQAADDAVFAQQGNSQAGAKAEALQQLAHARRVSALFEDIGDLDRFTR